MFDLMTTEPISTLVDNLPKSSITTISLDVLDFAVPGSWQNPNNFKELITSMTGVTAAGRLDAIENYANQLYNGDEKGAQRAVWLYQKIDQLDTALGAASMASVAGEKIGFLSFLKDVTPKGDTTQAIDLVMKLVAEIVAFCLMRGISLKSLKDFALGMLDYRSENLLRLLAVLTYDGLLPLGPNFLDKTADALFSGTTDNLKDNSIFQKVSSYLPGDNDEERVGFVQDVFKVSKSVLEHIAMARDLDYDSLLAKVNNTVEGAASHVDYLGAFFDMSTSYYSHTGIQSVARYMVERSAERFNTPLLTQK